MQPEFFIYRLIWNPERNKFDKKPCRLDGSSLTKDESPERTTRAIAAAAHAALPAGGYALGMWLSEHDNLFFIDLDECVDPATGTLDTVSSSIAAPFIAAGCFFEGSSGGKGAHIIGRYTGTLPAHCNRRPAAHKYEFYSRDRGVALTASHTGSMDVDATALLLPVLAEHFPARDTTALIMVGERRPEWRGPEDDDELIRRALAAKGSARAAFGHAATFADLWTGKVEHESGADLALASHLAFWTGCDVPRIERLMRRSGLVRAKWDEHRTYLVDITITRACATTRNVYQEPERKDTVGELMGSEQDWYAAVDTAISDINNSGTFRSLMEDIVPGIGAIGFPHGHAERVVSALAKRLVLFDSKLPIGAVRQLVTPPVMAGGMMDVPPVWFAGMCYILKNDKFYNTFTGSTFTAEGFRSEYSRLMPMKQNGDREDPVKWARERWQIVTVDDLGYRPDQGPFYEYAGYRYANIFRVSSMPQQAAPSAACTAAVEAFQRHLYLLCGNRDSIYIALLQWLAYNVQKPGKKIRWTPLIKGVAGDGKSIVGDLMRECLGHANVKLTSNATLTNSGGFTDWSTGKALNFIEEIRLEGKDKRNLYNSMKIFIGDTIIDVNKKGTASGDSMVNVTNHWANTNYGDAIPMDPGDRRWLIVFTPYMTIQEAMEAKGFSNINDLVNHFKWMGDSMRAEPGAWRAWMLGVDTSTFNPDARSIDTEEKESMRLMSSDVLDQAVFDAIQQGNHGVSDECFSSKSLWGLVSITMGEKPATRTWNALLTRLGYQQMTKMIWWCGTSHRVWVKKNMTVEKAREILESTTGHIK